jgi:RimK family alpha-L-glutamate ligase
VIVNPPRSLEIAIDKFATLARVQQLGYEVPQTIAVQSRREAMDAFELLGRDCVVKPIFGGEGRGVMRITDPQLAWYAFSTLEKLEGVCYVQKFVPPGGRDTRLLVIGEDVIGLRRKNDQDFRTNVSSGATCEAVDPSESDILMARRICDSIGLAFASVDLVDSQDGSPKVIEVNAIPGWKGAQEASCVPIAQRIIRLMTDSISARLEARC